MKIIVKILSIRINFILVVLLISGCAAPAPKRAIDDIGPVTARARNVLASENPRGLITVGEGFERAGDYRGARNLYGQAMAAAPDLTLAKIAYARVSAKLGRGDEAVAILASVLDADPADRFAKVTLARVHADADRYQAAITILDTIERPTADELVDLGKAAAAAGDSGKAHTAFARALDLAPDNPDVLAVSALSFALEKNYPSAVSLLNRVMNNPEAAGAAQQTLANVYALSGQRRAALSLARGVMSPEDVRKLELFYRLLTRFTPAEQAAALYYDRIPKDAVARLSGTVTN